MTARCNAAGQFLPPVLILTDVKKKYKFGDGLPPRSDVYINQKSSCISTHLCIKWVTEHFLTHKAAGRVILTLDGLRGYCSSPSLLQTAVENTATIIHLPNHYTHTLQILSKCFWRGGCPVKSYFRNEAVAWNRT